MPAWNKALSEQDMWKVTAFLSRIEKLPPAVQDYWKKSTGVAPPAVDPQGRARTRDITTSLSLSNRIRDKSASLYIMKGCARLGYWGRVEGNYAD